MQHQDAEAVSLSAAFFSTLRILWQWSMLSSEKKNSFLSILPYKEVVQQKDQKE